MAVDLKTLTPDTTLPQDGVLFGADSQSAANPSVYPVANVKDALNSGIATLATGPAIFWDCAASPVATFTLTQNATLYAVNFKAGGTYKLIVFQDATGGRTLGYDPYFHWPNDVTPTVSSGASAMTVFEFVSDGTGVFGTVSQPYDGYVPTVAAVFNAPNMEYQTPSWIDNSGTIGNRMYTDSTGTLTWAPANLIPTSATLTTQTITSGVNAGGVYILSAELAASASVAVSGGATATLSTSSSVTGSRYYVKLSALSTGSLTLTVTGTVTNAQLERVTYQTLPRALIVTTGTQKFLPRYNYLSGIVSEGQRTNLLIRSQEFTSASWSKGGATAVVLATGETSPDGTETAYRVSGFSTSDPDTGLAQNATTSPATLSGSVYVKGEGSDIGKKVHLQIKRIGGTLVIGSADITLTGSWQRISASMVMASDNTGAQFTLSGAAASNPASSCLIWGAQLEAGATPSSMIPTAGASVQRPADMMKLSGIALTTLQGAAASVIVETGPLQDPANNTPYLVSGDNASTMQFIRVYGSDVSASRAASTYIQATIGGGATWTANNVRSASGFNSSGRTIVANNGTAVSDSNTFGTPTTVGLGYDSSSSGGQINGTIRSIAIYSSRLPDATLKAKSVVGAAY